MAALRNMWRTRLTYLRLVILCLLIVATPDFIHCLKNVSVTVPTAVKKGENALLVCNYDLENDPLYSVKWYKGRREFYRYTPKENPAMKTFTVNGITVERSLSNQSHVMLSSVQPMISGKFSCEVSADAPSFHTMVVSAELEVVELPAERPIMTGIHSRYRLLDTVNGNCSSNYSKPAANLTWSINDIPVPYRYIRSYDPLKFENMESSVIEINFTLQNHHFILGQLKLKCTARIHSIYEEEVEKSIEEDRPRILASGQSIDASIFGYGSQAGGDLIDPNDFYSTQYKADKPSSASASSITRVSHVKTTCWYHHRRPLFHFLPSTIAERISIIIATLTLNGEILFIITLISIVASSRFNSTATISDYRRCCKRINHRQHHQHHSFQHNHHQPPHHGRYHSSSSSRGQHQVKNPNDTIAKYCPTEDRQRHDDIVIKPINSSHHILISSITLSQSNHQLSDNFIIQERQNPIYR